MMKTTFAPMFVRGGFALVSGASLGAPARIRSLSDEELYTNALFRVEGLPTVRRVQVARDVVWERDGDTVWVNGAGTFALAACVPHVATYHHPATRRPVRWVWGELVLLVATDGTAFVVEARHELDALYADYEGEVCSVEFFWPDAEEVEAELDVLNELGFARPTGDREILTGAAPVAAPSPPRAPAATVQTVGPFAVKVAADGRATLTHRFGGLVPAADGGHVRARVFENAAAARAVAHATWASLEGRAA